MRTSITSGLMAAVLGVLPAAAFAHPSDSSQPTDSSQSSDAQDQDQSEQSPPTGNHQSEQATDQRTPELDSFVVTATSGPRLGITVIGLTPELRAFYGAPRDRGVVVAHVERRSPAARAGLRVGDILISVQGESVANASDVLGALTSINRGEQIPLTVIRANQTINLQAMLPPNRPTSASSDDC
jgi:C-terminal processing protease CtpA/Prc